VHTFIAIGLLDRSFTCQLWRFHMRLTIPAFLLGLRRVIRDRLHQDHRCRVSATIMSDPSRITPRPT